MNSLTLTTIISGIFFLLNITPAFAAFGSNLLFENIRVIDGKGNDPVEAQDVLVVNGKIARVANHGSFNTASDIKRIDGEGLTLLPGLIDAHSHMFFNRSADWQLSLKEHLYAGVTSVNTTGGILEFELEAREYLANSDESFPSLSNSGYIQNGPTEGGKLPDAVESSGMTISLMSNRDVIASLDKHQAAGIKMVKAYMQMSLRRLEFFVEEAHKRDMRVIIDASRSIGTVAINRTGVDGYAHQPWHYPSSPEELSDAKQRGIWFISTLSVPELLGATDRYPLADQVESLVTAPLITPFYGEGEVRTASAGLEMFIAGAKRSFVEEYGEKYNESANDWFEIASENTRRLLDAGIVVGMGTDTRGHWALRPPGWMLHYEMELWDEIDIDPLQAIQAATNNNARILKVEHQTGSITEGLEADLLIVAGNPAINITDTRNIKYVVLDGKLVDRQSLVANKSNQTSGSE